MFQNFQPLAAIATTPNGARKLQPLCQSSGATLWVPPSLSHIPGVEVYPGSLKDHLAGLWQRHHSFVFCLAAGAVTRLIAPLLADKANDPAVVVVDEAGRFAISLCSGHQGGADRLAKLVALQIGATAVLTGAADGLGLPGIDIFGLPFGWQRGAGNWTAVSAAVARGETVQVIQQTGSKLWQQHLPGGHNLVFENPNLPATAQIFIGNETNLGENCVNWHPRVLWLGIGCERGTSAELMAYAIQQSCQSANLVMEAIAGIATLDLKADEVGLLAVCGNKWPLKTFSAEELQSIVVPNPSQVVAAEVGTPSVAEAAALKAANSQQLLVEKQIFRAEQIDNSSGAVTVAIAQSEVEYTGRNGQLFLVGTGPGKLAQMTPAAQSAISQADAIIGYALYLDLIAPLLRPGQIVEAFPITQERQRSQRAIALAKWGLTVAVISSGDAGIYGMAGLVLEDLQAQNWDGKTPAVEIFPGISALQAAASRVGTPLMHDFCAISLSDLLTPWEVIEKRLIAAAQADFTTALYNPRSQTRIQQLAIAQSIFLQYRQPHTPVAIVRSAYRDDEQITLTSLGELLETPVDMLTTVLIGNSSTRIHADWMITPRGYRV